MYLLDTHTFLWMDHDPDNLSDTAREICKERSNQLLLSTVSIWEMQIKYQLGKLKLPADLPYIIENQVSTNDMTILSIEPVQIYKLATLPDIHRDPFDRMLIAQALLIGSPIITKDKKFSGYPIDTIW